MAARVLTGAGARLPRDAALRARPVVLRTRYTVREDAKATYAGEVVLRAPDVMQDAVLRGIFEIEDLDPVHLVEAGERGCSTARLREPISQQVVCESRVDYVFDVYTR